MVKIVEYKVVRASCIRASASEVYVPSCVILTEAITMMIQNGWQPYGYPLLWDDDDVAQAMVKYEV